MKIYAVGSSYLIFQAPGGAWVGGVTVKIKRSGAAAGTWTVTPTDYRRDRSFEADVIAPYADAAKEGIERFAAESGIDLNEWDVTVSEFAYHEVDSAETMFKIAGFNAAASAFASWERRLVTRARRG